MRNGGFFCIANTFRSFRVHSTVIFLDDEVLLQASRVPLCSARNTCAWREGFEVVVSVENMAEGSFWLFLHIRNHRYMNIIKMLYH